MKNMSKIFVLIIAVALAFGALSMYSFAADDGAYTTVYLVPNATWSEDNARFAVYCVLCTFLYCCRVFVMMMK